MSWDPPADDDDARRWLQLVDDFRANAVAKIASSACTISLCPPDDGFDVKFALELGASVMLNKPIVVVAFPGRTVLPGLARVAHAVITMEADFDTEAGQAEFEAKLGPIMESMGIRRRG